MKINADVHDRTTVHFGLLLFWKGETASMGKKIFIDKHELAEKEDIINPNLAYGVAKQSDNEKALGTVHDFTLSSKGDTDNWTFCIILLKTTIHKGDIFTISAFGTLTGPNAADGNYKASIYSSDTSHSFDPTGDTVFLKSGIRSSKTFVANADSDPNNPPVLLIYSGKAGSTGQNSIHVQNVKVERGSVATPYVPAVEDLVLKSDYDALSDRLTALESKMGGDGTLSH